MAIRFFSEATDFKLLYPNKTRLWLAQAIKAEKRFTGTINYIFCSDPYLLEINQRYLNHNTYTDIVTFDSSDDPKIIEGDIYISIDRVIENSAKFFSFPDEELRRVMIHGVLHLIGYSDKEDARKKLMRRKEDSYLSLWV